MAPALQRAEPMWMLNTGGQQGGPFSDAQIMQMLQTGQVRDGWIAQQGTNNWIPLAQHPLFASASQGMATRPAALVAGQQRPPAKRMSPGVIVALILAFAAIAGGGLFLFVVARDDASHESDRKRASPEPSAKVQTVDDVIAPRKTKIEAKVAAVLKIAGNMPATTTQDSLKPEGGPIALLSGSVPDIAKGIATAKGANATILHVEDMKGDMTEHGEPMYYAGEALLLVCSAIIRQKSPPSTFDPKNDLTATAALLDLCAELKFVAVIRTAKSAEPVVDTANSRYVPGYVEGDVVLFDIDTGKHLGGYQFSARNGPQLTVNLQDPVRDLMREVRQNMWSSIKDGLSKNDSTSKLVKVEAQ